MKRVKTIMKNSNDKNEEFIQEIISGGHDISRRTLKNNCGNIEILFIKQLTERYMLSNYIIRPIIDYYSSYDACLNVEIVLNQIIPIDDCFIENDYNKILDHILNGMTVIIFPNEDNFIVANIKNVEKKAIESPELTYTMRGPKDSFTENLDVNLSLIRYRIKDPSFKINILYVGRRTKVRIATVYIEDIANDNCVNEILKRISNINTDGIIESGELQSYLLNNKLNFFPQMGLVERSDVACSELLQGKVVVITEGSGIALIAPKTFTEFLWAYDDNYDNKYIGIFSKIFRIISLIINLTLTPLYVAFVSFHSDILPGEYIITLATTRATVPFNALTEALLVEIVLEILREALLRVPNKIGPAIGIVGAIIIGQAAVAAGIFSPLILISASLSLLSSFVAPDYTIVNPVRILKFFMLIMSGTFGLLGFITVLNFIIINITSINSFGIPYFAPFAPFNRYDFFTSFFSNKTIATQRPNFLRTKNKKRG